MRWEQSRLNSSIRSDGGVAPYEYSGDVHQSRTKALTYPDGVGYHHEVISSCTAGFIPSKDGYIRNAGGHFFGGAARNLGGSGKALPFAPVGEITAGVIKQGVNVCRCRFAAKMLCVRSTRHSLYTCSLLQGRFYFHITSLVSPKKGRLPRY